MANSNESDGLDEPDEFDSERRLSWSAVVALAIVCGTLIACCALGVWALIVVGPGH
jgi:hypothetical protein